MRLEVDGEQVEIRRRPDDPQSYNYDWVSGPNEGYGFCSRVSQPIELTREHHEARIHDFLASIDPESGYL